MQHGKKVYPANVKFDAFVYDLFYRLYKIGDYLQV